MGTGDPALTNGQSVGIQRSVSNLQILKSQTVMSEEVTGTANFFLPPEVIGGALKAGTETVGEAAHVPSYIVRCPTSHLLGHPHGSDCNGCMSLLWSMQGKAASVVDLLFPDPLLAYSPPSFPGCLLLWTPNLWHSIFLSAS